MILYTNTTGQLKEVKEKPFKLERDIQKLFEANLPAIMGLEVVKSELTIKNRRIDTLAFDPQSKAFIIIEYKRDKNISVVDQGFTYLSLMLENKGEFVAEYNESRKLQLRRDEVDWSQTRVSFVSTSFTDNQRQATNFKDIAIELWEVKQYENDTIIINPVKKSNSAESIKPLTQNEAVLKTVTEEIKVYTEDDHFQGKNDDVKELYETFRNAILSLPADIEVVPKKTYIAFKMKRNIVDIEVQANTLKLWINMKKGTLNDSMNLMRDVSMLKGHNGNGDYELIVKDTTYLEYIMSLVKQAL